MGSLSTLTGLKPPPASKVSTSLPEVGCGDLDCSPKNLAMRALIVVDLSMPSPFY